MTRYKIPENILPGFKIITQLNENQLNELSIILKTLDSKLFGENDQKRVSEKLSISFENVQDLIQALIGIYSLQIDSSESNESIIKNLLQSYSIHLIESEKEVIIKKLEICLEKILSSGEKVTAKLKSFELLSENSKNYIDSRVLSDIRLSFNTNLSQPVNNAVIIHQLKLRFKENGETKEVYISLDGNDLDDLKKTIDRAIEKEELISSNNYTQNLLFHKYKN